MNAEVLALMSWIAFGASAVLAIVATVMFFRFNIGELSAILSGKKAERQIQELREQNKGKDEPNKRPIEQIHRSAYRIESQRRAAGKTKVDSHKQEVVNALLQAQSANIEEGTMLLTEETMCLDEGTMLLTEETMCLDEGTMLLTEETMCLDEGTMLLADETTLLDEGTTVLEEKENKLENGYCLLFEEIVVHTNEGV